MSTERARRFIVALLFSIGLFAAGCGGGEPEGEATWETHTTAPAQSAGSEEAGGADGASSEEAAAE